MRWGIQRDASHALNRSTPRQTQVVASYVQCVLLQVSAIEVCTHGLPCVVQANNEDEHLLLLEQVVPDALQKRKHRHKLA